MEILIIVGAVLIGYIAFKASPGLLQNVRPAQPSNASGSTPLDLQTIENQIQALTPKPVDPLAPKGPAPVPVNIYANIKPTLSAVEAFNEAKQSEANLNPRDFANADYLNTVYKQIEAMHTIAWRPATGGYLWSGNYQPSGDLRLVGQGSQLALSVAGQIATKVGSSVASAIPFIGTAVSGIVGLFSAISAHHAAAVQRDSNAYNTGLSTAENYLAIIHDAVGSGQSTPEEGINALDSMYSDFLRFTAPARNNKPYCNSVCEAKIQLNAVVIYWKAFYTQVILSRS
jgi:hypothetical protein